MTGKILSAALLVMFCAVLAYAQDPSGDAWWNGLKARAEKIADSGTSATAQDEEDPIYWKGRRPEPAVSGVELKRFMDALDLALQESGPEALEAFEGFLRLYPSSLLKGEAGQAIEHLKAGQ